MPRTKKPPKNQRTVFDIVIEDGELAEALAAVAELEPQAAAYREARQVVKKLIQTEHPDAINALTLDGHERWTVVEGYRFLYKTAERPAAKKVAAAGVTTVLDIRRLALEAPAGDVPATETVRMNVNGEAAPVERIPLSPEAERLIRDSAPPVDDLTEEQQEARASLANTARSGR